MKKRVHTLLALLLALTLLAACEVPIKHYGNLVRGEVASLKVRDNARWVVKDIPYAPGADDYRMLDIYKVASAEPAPVLVFIHGGSWQSGDRRMYSALGETLRAEGIVTVIPNYRMYPEVTYPVYLEDGAAIINWVNDHIAEFGGDPNRVIVSGHSAGGQMAALLVTNERFRKMLTFDVRKLRGAACLSGAYDFDNGNLLNIQMVREVMGTPENFRDSQPIHHVRADVPPLLIVNGDRDTLTGEAQAAAFAKAMKAAGADVQYEMLPGGDHYSVVIDLMPGMKGPTFRHLVKFINEKAGPVP